MKILFVFAACLSANCLASAPGKRTEGHRPPPPHREAGHKIGWGWNSDTSPLYGQPPKCVDPATIPTAPYGDLVWFGRKRLWYLHGTAYGQNLYYRSFNGPPATKQSQIDQMCPTVTFSTSSSIQTNSGNGVQWQQICLGTETSTCTPIYDPATYDEGVDLFAIERQDYKLLKTDAKTYAIYYCCNDYVHGDLQLFTTRPYVSPELTRTFLSFFKNYNISTNQAEFSICSSPKFGPYPHPFENYPNSAGGPNSNGWGASGWNSTVSTDGWSANNGWSDNSNGWSPSPPSDGWSSNGWGSDSGPSSSGWGWDNQGWSAKVGKKEKDKKTEEVKKTEEAVAEVVAEVAL